MVEENEQLVRKPNSQSEGEKLNRGKGTLQELGDKEESEEISEENNVGFLAGFRINIKLLKTEVQCSTDDLVARS
jgi:hypothetical protein